MGKNAKGKAELSIKKALTPTDKPTRQVQSKPKSSDFEDKLSMFLKRSEEKQIDIRRNLKIKQGITKKRK